MNIIWNILRVTIQTNVSDFGKKMNKTINEIEMYFNGNHSSSICCKIQAKIFFQMQIGTIYFIYIIIIMCVLDEMNIYVPNKGVKNKFVIYYLMKTTNN